MSKQRIDNALEILQSWKMSDYRYLGSGFGGVVFHDGVYVYKVHFALAGNEFNESETLQYLSMKRDLFQNRTHFYEVTDMVDHRGTCILVYPYEESVPVSKLTREDLISFLHECWELKVVIKSIKPTNFIRVAGTIKLIDNEIVQFNDALFINMIVRSYVHMMYPDHDAVFFNKLKRSAINNFAMAELAGLDDFIEDVFDSIVCAQYPAHDFSQQAVIKPHRSVSLSEPVSLVIKCCIQDAKILYPAVKHIVSQLGQPDVFDERVLAVDYCKGEDFLREYDCENSKDDLEKMIERLLDHNLIDRVIRVTNDMARETNAVWFGLDSEYTHTASGVPVTPQLCAFDQAQNDLILQADIDVMIGRHDYDHSYLSDMISAIRSHPHVASVAFGIKHSGSTGFQPYFGYENGGFVPEVRLCMLSRSRLKKLIPLPNAALSNGLELSWYRSVEKKQKETNFTSIRGGDHRTFYIHPQNYRKADERVWMTMLDRVEQLHILEKQNEKVDLQGSYYELCQPKRNEPVVVVCILYREVTDYSLRRFLDSLRSQAFSDWGLILIENRVDDADATKLQAMTGDISDKVTIIVNRIEEEATCAHYKAIHYFMENTDTLAVLIDGTSALIGKHVLEYIANDFRNYGADLGIGRDTDAYGGGSYSVNFLHPRQASSNVDKGLQVFRKDLFDRLSIYDLKYHVKTNNTMNHIAKMSKEFKWIPDHKNLAVMVPLVEICRNPIRLEHISCLKSKAKPGEKGALWSILENKTSPRLVHGDSPRRHFAPNMNRIEIDITFDCNLYCHGCNRSCTQAPSADRMTIEQIAAFVEESQSLDKKWTHVNILGGEPTLHPDFLEIVRMLSNAFHQPGLNHALIQITSNGTPQAQAALEKLPKHVQIIIDVNSFKTDRNIAHFNNFNAAPIDDDSYVQAEFTKGCWVTAYCGIGLNRYGLYACSVAGGIDRVMGFGVGASSLKEFTSEVAEKQKRLLCRYCGNYIAFAPNHGDFIPRHERNPYENILPSPSWRKAYDAYHERPPRLPLVYDDFGGSRGE